jgi:hypothetical protein
MAQVKNLGATGVHNLKPAGFQLGIGGPGMKPAVFLAEASRLPGGSQPSSWRKPAVFLAEAGGKKLDVIFKDNYISRNMGR